MPPSPEEMEYFQRRAEAQLELAQRTDHSAAVMAHVTIAEKYLELCEPARKREIEKRGGRPRLRPLFT